MGTLKVFKYEVDFTAKEISLPKGAKVLHADVQQSNFGNGIYIWALVNPNEGSKESRFFYACPTGGLVYNDSDVYIGSAQTKEGFMFHVFECFE
jgi:hypothetical protein